METATPAKPPRLPWVDAARCLAMLPIIWMHAGAAPSWSGRLVGGSLFLFFLLAGYFMPRRPQDMLKRAGKLLLAWGLWSLIAAALYYAVDPATPIRWQKVVGWGEDAYNTPLWFLRSLAAYYLLTALAGALRLLPRYGWLLLILFVGFAYHVDAPQQHTLRFDWYWVLLLGHCLRAVPPAVMEAKILRHRSVLTVAAVAALCQPSLLHALFGEAAECSLPVHAAAYALLCFLAAVACVRRLPRLGRGMARIGSGMVFVYVTHSFFLAPFYMGYDLTVAWNLWVPFVLLPLLSLSGLWLNRHFPRTMKILTAR